MGKASASGASALVLQDLVVSYGNGRREYHPQLSFGPLREDLMNLLHAEHLLSRQNGFIASAGLLSRAYLMLHAGGNSNGQERQLITEIERYGYLTATILDHQHGRVVVYPKVVAPDDGPLQFAHTRGGLLAGRYAFRLPSAERIPPDGYLTDLFGRHRKFFDRILGIGTADALVQLSDAKKRAPQFWSPEEMDLEGEGATAEYTVVVLGGNAAMVANPRKATPRLHLRAGENIQNERCFRPVRTEAVERVEFKPDQTFVDALRRLPVAAMGPRGRKGRGRSRHLPKHLEQLLDEE